VSPPPLKTIEIKIHFNCKIERYYWLFCLFLRSSFTRCPWDRLLWKQNRVQIFSYTLITMLRGSVWNLVVTDAMLYFHTFCSIVFDIQTGIHHSGCPDFVRSYGVQKEFSCCCVPSMHAKIAFRTLVRRKQVLLRCWRWQQVNATKHHLCHGSDVLPLLYCNAYGN